ncbi:MAG: hypothetical protein IT447_04380 [Phycisphaerales bacterium]|jgi:hypothetical protein|nr:hypothetical protein [Phycisphaerales bacterium]
MMLGEVILTLLVCIAILVIAAAVFGAWIIMMLVKMALGLMGLKRKSTRKPSDGLRVCSRRGCGHANPPQARFCSRCGMALEATQPSKMKRVAMF